MYFDIINMCDISLKSEAVVYVKESLLISEGLFPCQIRIGSFKVAFIWIKKQQHILSILKVEFRYYSLTLQMFSTSSTVTHYPDISLILHEMVLCH